ncbi:superoxide dismutase, partial [Patescibacteria group bacterium]|nr:superoxide dismutase [Patescibacteria group bacterium]MBU1967373.1 superoxide dismutase [Patescibacteria group bacterium]
EFDALEPSIDAVTMEIHYSKHHQGYVDKLNTALKGHPDLLKKDVTELLRNLEDLPADIQTAVKNNGGGHANHSLFWTVISPDGGGAPKGNLSEALETRFKSLDDFKAEFETVALSHFGSGWVWLVVDNDGDLQVYSTANQDSPLIEDETPILTLDVWEHAYYLQYQNRRADYIKAFWKIVDWAEVARRFKETS